MATNSGGYLFNCGVDDISESEVDELLRSMNYSIDHMITTIIFQYSDSRGADRHPVSHQQPLKIDDTLLQIINKYRLSERNARILVVEFYLRNLIITSIHSHFFEGEHFFGVGSESLRGNLDHMMNELIVNGKLSIRLKIVFVNIRL